MADETFGISVLEAPLRLRTVAASDDLERQMDQLENEAQEGPCLDSITEDSFQRGSALYVFWSRGTASSTLPTLTSDTACQNTISALPGANASASA